jgi:hypothetical protein
MYMTPLEAEMLMKERTKEALRETEHRRLMRLASAGRPRPLDRALAGIGGLLLSAGEWLQKRYGTDRTGLARSPSPATR